MKHLVDLVDFSEHELADIINTAKYISKNPAHYNSAAAGKIMAALFYEPSTRTQNSFKSAMMRLGGGVIGFDNPSGSSVVKGESLKDTVKMFGSYADLIVMRHFEEGSAKKAAEFSDVPFINAGDGGNLHPTQTLTDLVTLECEKRVDNLKIGICGDLKYGRTAHSLIKSMSKYPNNSFVFISSETLKIPDEYKSYSKCEEARSLNADVLSELDVLYMTRIQRERLAESEQAKRGEFILTAELMKSAKNDLAVLHPLPRNEEIAEEIDGDPRALFFKQAKYGVFARMALILKLIVEKF